MIDPWTIDDEWVDIPTAAHQVRPWCVEEKCYACAAPAAHKIEETTGAIGSHPYTAYVCCNHFFGYCKRPIDESFNRA